MRPKHLATMATVSLVLVGLCGIILSAPAAPQVEAARDVLYCASCGEQITGEYVSALGKYWHPEHFVCANCRTPLAEATFYEKDGRPYCQSCYEDLFLPHCCICGRPIRSAYIENVWGDVYCKKHEHEFQTCFSCGRLICGSLTGGGLTHDDGRHMCSLCGRTAVYRVEDGEVVLDEVRRAMKVLGLDLRSASIPLRMVSLEDLREGRARDLSGHISTSVWTRGGKVTERKIEAVSILYGLPREHFAAVAAHELMHAWLFLENYPELPLHVEEGLAELSSYLWLQQLGTPEAAYRMRAMESNDDPVYGYGLRLALKSCRQVPLDKLLGYIKRQRRFPVEVQQGVEIERRL
ncbi:MAG: protein DA1 [Candidatus Eisenbacteria sp.]|nr:protein DA1 [Candidatus Eisenbacteria bacterium]